MNISFPINHYSQAFNILSDIFEVELCTSEESFSFLWDGNKITCHQLNNQPSTDAMGLIVELFHWQHTCFEMEKRLELYCYKNHIELEKIGIKLNRIKQNLTWKISPIVTLEVYFTPSQEITIS